MKKKVTKDQLNLAWRKLDRKALVTAKVRVLEYFGKSQPTISLILNGEREEKKYQKDKDALYKAIVKAAKTRYEEAKLNYTEIKRIV